MAIEPNIEANTFVKTALKRMIWATINMPIRI